MSVRLVRESSETPNVTNKDDARMVRYAYGGYDGFVKNYGSELSSSVENGVFKIGSGRIILQGWEVDLDVNGWELNINQVYGTAYYSIYLEVNLIAETATIKSTYALSEYPDIDPGDDLTVYPSGTARIVLYHLKINSGNAQEILKVIPVVRYFKDVIKEAGFKKASVEDGGIVFNDDWTGAYDPLVGLVPIYINQYCSIKKSGVLCLLDGIEAYGHGDNVGTLDITGTVVNKLTVHAGIITILPEEYRPKSKLVYTGKLLYFKSVYNQIFGTYVDRFGRDIEITIDIDGSVSFPQYTIDEILLFDETHPVGISLGMRGWEVNVYGV